MDMATISLFTRYVFTSGWIAGGPGEYPVPKAPHQLKHASFRAFLVSLGREKKESLPTQNPLWGCSPKLRGCLFSGLGLTNEFKYSSVQAFRSLYMATLYDRTCYSLSVSYYGDF